MERVLAIDVLRETVAFIKYKAGLIAGLFGVMLVLAFFSLWQTGRATPGEYPLSLVMTHLSVIVFGTFAQVCFVQYVIRTLRLENPPLVPQGVVGKLLRMFSREIILMFTLLVPGLVVMIAVMAVPIMIVGEHPGIGGGVLVGLSAIIGWLVGFGMLGVRLGAGIAGASVGEKMSFKESWRMTRGYTFALSLFLVPVFAPQMFLQVLVAPQPGEVMNFFSPGMIAVSILSSILYWFTAVAFSVWYVRLTERFVAEDVQNA